MKHLRKFISVILTLAIIFGLFPMIPAAAADIVYYLESSWNETKQTVVDEIRYCAD